MLVLWFPFFSTWWWMLTVLAIFLIFAFEENDSAMGAFMCLVFYWIILVTLGEGGSILRWIGAHPWYSVSAAGLYVFFGLPWAAFWWKWKQTEEKDEYNSARRKFLLSKGVIKFGESQKGVEIPDQYLSEWNSSRYSYPSFSRATWTEHRSTLTCAMTWWPFHMLAFFFKDFLRNMWNQMLNTFHALFDAIDEKTWKDVNSDFREVVPPSKQCFEESRQNTKF